MSALAEMRGLCVRYGERAALEPLDLDLAAGEILAVIGESGSGKTTLALALAGLLPSNARLSGRIGWPGFAQNPRPGRDIGFVFQDPAASFDPLMTVGAQLAEVLRAHLPLDRAAAREQAAALLARARIPEPEAAARRYPHQFSGGQKQRVAIALAIAARPRLLIADEPTSALDTIVQREVVTLLRDLVRADGMTMLFVTHDIALASGLADRIAVFRHGRLLECGPARALLSAPQTDYAKALIAAVPTLEAADG